MKIHNNGTCAVSRAVFADNDLVVKIHFLSQYAFDRLPDKTLLVVGDD
jgi:hypothetical protein